MKEGQTKKVMDNGRLFKIDVEEGRIANYTQVFHPFFFSFLSSLGLEFSCSCMAWDMGRWFF